MQTKTQSWIEVCAATAVGFVISISAGQLVYPLFGMHPSIATNAKVTAIFTVISIVRSYFVRRFFNWLHNR